MGTTYHAETEASFGLWESASAHPRRLVEGGTGAYVHRRRCRQLQAAPSTVDVEHHAAFSDPPQPFGERPTRSPDAIAASSFLPLPAPLSQLAYMPLGPPHLEGTVGTVATSAWVPTEPRAGWGGGDCLSISHRVDRRDGGQPRTAQRTLRRSQSGRYRADEPYSMRSVRSSPVQYNIPQKYAGVTAETVAGGVDLTQRVDATGIVNAQPAPGNVGDGAQSPFGWWADKGGVEAEPSESRHVSVEEGTGRLQGLAQPTARSSNALFKVLKEGERSEAEARADAARREAASVEPSAAFHKRCRVGLTDLAHTAQARGAGKGTPGGTPSGVNLGQQSPIDTVRQAGPAQGFSGTCTAVQHVEPGCGPSRTSGPDSRQPYETFRVSRQHSGLRSRSGGAESALLVTSTVDVHTPGPSGGLSKNARDGPPGGGRAQACGLNPAKELVPGVRQAGALCDDQAAACEGCSTARTQPLLVVGWRSPEEGTWAPWGPGDGHAMDKQRVKGRQRPVDEVHVLGKLTAARVRSPFASAHPGGPSSDASEPVRPLWNAPGALSEGGLEVDGPHRASQPVSPFFGSGGRPLALLDEGDAGPSPEGTAGADTGGLLHVGLSGDLPQEAKLEGSSARQHDSTSRPRPGDLAWQDIHDTAKSRGAVWRERRTARHVGRPPLDGPEVRPAGPLRCPRRFMRWPRHTGGSELEFVGHLLRDWRGMHPRTYDHMCVRVTGFPLARPLLFWSAADGRNRCLGSAFNPCSERCRPFLCGLVLLDDLVGMYLMMR